MSPDPTPEKKALDYVESLGVHSVYDAALASRKELGDKVLEHSSLRARKRELESLKADHEMAVVEDEYHKHTDMSVAAMERHLKVVFSNDADIRGVKDELMFVQGQLDALEGDISLLETDIRVAASRLHELGGLTHFMAAIKQAETTRKSHTDGDPWK